MIRFSGSYCSHGRSNTSSHSSSDQEPASTVKHSGCTASVRGRTSRRARATAAAASSSHASTCSHASSCNHAAADAHSSRRIASDHRSSRGHSRDAHGSGRRRDGGCEGHFGNAGSAYEGWRRTSSRDEVGWCWGGEAGVEDAIFEDTVSSDTAATCEMEDVLTYQ